MRDGKSSRQLLVFNDSQFYKHKQCFNIFQFLKTEEAWEMIVFQRSADIKKIYNDYSFFGYIANKFEMKTAEKIENIRILYGNVHEKIKK